ncbi:hypothetical protein GCM10011392_32320 [Wenxinia marina]|nr:hypothetical protein GCM10011392_32320 [Wenxinia marina]
MAAAPGVSHPRTPVVYLRLGERGKAGAAGPPAATGGKASHPVRGRAIRVRAGAIAGCDRFKALLHRR